MMKLCEYFRASAVRLARSCNCRWIGAKVPACTLVFAFAWLFLAGAAGAVDDIWDGSSSVNWSDTANWNLNAVPGSGDVVRFDNLSTGNLNTNNDIVGLSISGIANTSDGTTNPTGAPNIGGTYTQVSITGNPITIGAIGLVNGSGNPLDPNGYKAAQVDLTVDVDLTLSADQQWKLGGPGTNSPGTGRTQAIIVGSSPNAHTVTLNGFKPTWRVISNPNDMLVVNSKLVDGSVPSGIRISKLTGTPTSFSFDSGNINSDPRVRITGDSTYSGGTEIIGGRQIIQIGTSSVPGVSGPFGTGPITIHTESLVSGTITSQYAAFSPYLADRSVDNDINLTPVANGGTPNPSFPTLLISGSTDDSLRTLTLNGLISVPASASLQQNNVSPATHKSSSGDVVVNGSILLGGADFNSDGTVDAADYVAWRKNPAAHGGADGYKSFRENFGYTIPIAIPTTGTFTVGQTGGAPTSTTVGKQIFNGNIVQTNNATYTLLVTNGDATRPAVVQLYGQNTYAGGTNLTATDPSSPTSPANLGVGSSSTLSGPTIVSGPLGTGTLTVGTATAAATSSIESLGGAQTVANPISVPTLTAVLVVRGSNDLTLSGDIAGSGSVTMNGTGKLTLSGTNSTFLNFTNVNSGTVLVNGTLTASGALVAAGATVGGTGTIAAGITNNGTIAPGATGVGTLTSGTGSVTGNITDNGTSAWAIDLSGTASDLLAVTGSIALSGTDSLNVAGLGSGSSWIIASYTGTLSGTFGSVTSGYSVDYGTGSNSVITLHTAGSGATVGSVPEPASFVLGIFAFGFGAGIRRRRK